MSDPSDFQGMNKYQVYRKIRADRAYRTLGKMNACRVIVGVLLLVLVFLISGGISQYFAARGSFKTANVLMIAPGWVEKYKPELKAYIQAGILYQDGDYSGAYDAFAAIDELDAAASMKESSAVKIALLALAQSDYEKAYESIISIDPAVLTEADLQEYRGVCDALLAYYGGLSDSASSARARDMENALGSLG